MLKTFMHFTSNKGSIALPKTAKTDLGSLISKLLSVSVLLSVLGLFIFMGYVYMDAMNTFEVIIFVTLSAALLYLSSQWKAMGKMILAIGLLSLFALSQYQNALSSAETNFALKYFFASQSAIMWMSALFVLSTLTYLVHTITNRSLIGVFASRLTWAAVIIGFVGLFVRWHESYLIDPEIGYVPISNLYEVFILFCLITAVIYLKIESRIVSYKLGCFCLPIITSAVAFLLWYAFDKQAYHIQPLVPALNSYWMKIHVPANFIGYGAFALAAMTSVAWLCIFWSQKHYPQHSWTSRFPSLVTIDEVVYRMISLGFFSFTIATILGALWAAEAWGGYWSWDPKETWALIVWLNYAAWLHFRISKGWRGVLMAWWSIIGLAITLFAFLGVNMFLSGLHSYGEL